MNRRLKLLLTAVGASMVLTGCGMRTMDQLYCMPKRPESFYSLQKAIDQARGDMKYCAPLTGEHQQTVQMADLDGDGKEEYLLFARGSGEKPLNIFIFQQAEEDSYRLADQICCNGSAFEQVDYVQLDGTGGAELVVGCQVSEQLMRSVSVYSFAQGKCAQLMSANYSKLLTMDFDKDGIYEMMLLRPGQSETDPGIAELFSIRNGQAERAVEVKMSQSADHLKRVMTGKLEDGVPAVFVASSVNESAIVTDIFAVVNGKFTNITAQNSEGNSVETLRNYYVYATDIDHDGVLELPSLVNTVSMFRDAQEHQQWLISWYSLDSSGKRTDKMYTFHNFQNGWYLNLNTAVAPDTSVFREELDGSALAYQFRIPDGGKQKTYMTVYELTGPDREERAVQDNRFVLYRGDNIIYAARLETVCAELGITQDGMVSGFGLMHREWNPGET